MNIPQWNGNFLKEFSDNDDTITYKTSSIVN